MSLVPIALPLGLLLRPFLPKRPLREIHLLPLALLADLAAHTLGGAPLFFSVEIVLLGFFLRANPYLGSWLILFGLAQGGDWIPSLGRPLTPGDGLIGLGLVHLVATASLPEGGRPQGRSRGLTP